MIAFKYKEIDDVDLAHFVLKGMEIPGEPIKEELDSDRVVVWESDKFIALYHPKETAMVLYGTKSTNSVNYFIMRYPKLQWDTWHLIRTKRW